MLRLIARRPSGFGPDPGSNDVSVVSCKCCPPHPAPRPRSLSAWPGPTCPAADVRPDSSSMSRTMCTAKLSHEPPRPPYHIIPTFGMLWAPTRPPHTHPPRGKVQTSSHRTQNTRTPDPLFTLISSSTKSWILALEHDECLQARPVPLARPLRSLRRLAGMPGTGEHARAGAVHRVKSQERNH